MMLLMQDSIFLEGPVSLFSSLGALSKIILRASLHVVYVAWTKAVVVYDLVAYSSITMFLGWLQICS